MKIEVEFKTLLFLFLVFVIAVVAWRVPKDLGEVLAGIALFGALSGFFWWAGDQ